MLSPRILCACLVRHILRIGGRGMSTAGILSAIAWASMVASVVVVVSVLRLHGHAWKEAGHWRWFWALLPIATFFALLSIPVMLWYYLKIRPDVAAADANCIAGRQANRRARAANRPMPAQQSSTASNWLAAAPAKQACSACTNGKQMCWTCHGRGSVQDYDGTFKSCYACTGGYTSCAMCGGSGYR